MFRKTIDVVIKSFSSSHNTKVLVERYQFLYITFYKRETILRRDQWVHLDQ